MFALNGLTAEAPLGPFEKLHAEVAEAIAAHDAGVAVWRAKRKYDAVRPFSVINSLYANEMVTAYGGPGFGTVDDLPGAEWQSCAPPITCIDLTNVYLKGDASARAYTPLAL